MSLIEVLAIYAEIVKESGRAEANQFLSDCVDDSIREDIITSVNDRGQLIGATGEIFLIVSPNL